MRIFQVIEATANSLAHGNQTWFRCLYEPLVEMGHEVVLFSSQRGRIARDRRNPRLRERFSQEMVEEFHRENERKRFDLFFAYLTEGMVEPGAIDDIRKTGVPTCNFSCNNTHQFYLVEIWRAILIFPSIPRSLHVKNFWQWEPHRSGGLWPPIRNILNPSMLPETCLSRLWAQTMR